MINVNNLRLQFGGRVLFEDVNLKFDGGNCYGIIGANGAGKSTFLKLITKQLEPSSGDVVIERGKRLSVLSQDQKAWDDYTVLSTVMHGYERLMEIMKEKDELYAKPDFTEADGIRAGELENEFMEIGGWEAESEAQNLLNELGIHEEFFEVLTLKQLQQLNKPLVIFNINHYYDKFEELLVHTVETGFMKQECKNVYRIFDSADDIMTYIENYNESTVNVLKY